MTLFDRLLAELMKPDRFGISTVMSVPSGKARELLVLKNAEHRLASILKMIAEDEGMLEKMLNEYQNKANGVMANDRMRAALSAALLHIAGGE